MIYWYIPSGANPETVPPGVFTLLWLCSSHAFLSPRRPLCLRLRFPCPSPYLRRSCIGASASYAGPATLQPAHSRATARIPQAPQWCPHSPPGLSSGRMPPHAHPLPAWARLAPSFMSSATRRALLKPSVPGLRRPALLLHLDACGSLRPQDNRKLPCRGPGLAHHPRPPLAAQQS